MITYEKACAGKVKHLSEASAERFRARHKDGKDMRVYQCPYCGVWHIGHPPSVPIPRKRTSH